MFYQPGDSDRFLNHLVTKYDPPYSHCDVQFEDGMASSVFQNEKLYWKQRKFSKPGYKRITVSVDDHTYRKAYNLCADRFRQGFNFDAIGMYSLPLSSMFSIERDKKTFCSKHCVEVLQVAGARAVTSADPHKVTPSALYRMLEASSVIHAGSSPLAGLRIDAPSKPGP
jgi:hypothetical protein